MKTREPRRRHRDRGVHAPVQELARVLLRAGDRVRPARRVEGDRGLRPGDAGRVLVHQGGDRRLLRWPAVPGHRQGGLHHRQEGRRASRARDRPTTRGRRSTTSDDDEEADTDLPRPPHQIAAGSVQLADADDLEVEEISTSDDDVVIDEDSPEEHDLDAFIEGRKRPSHLDESGAGDFVKPVLQNVKCFHYRRDVGVSPA